MDGLVPRHVNDPAGAELELIAVKQTNETLGVVLEKLERVAQNRSRVDPEPPRLLPERRPREAHDLTRHRVEHTPRHLHALDELLGDNGATPRPEHIQR